MMKISWKAFVASIAVLIGGASLLNRIAEGVVQDEFNTVPSDATLPPAVSSGSAFPSAPQAPAGRYLDTVPDSGLFGGPSNGDPFGGPSSPGGLLLPDTMPGPTAATFRRSQYSQEFLSSLNQLQNPEAEEPQRAAAREVVSKALVEQFDEDMKARQQQLEQLEKTLARLKAQFEKRKASRDQIVQLQLQLIENDAAGLGFPTSWNRMRGMKRQDGPFFDDVFDRTGPDSPGVPFASPQPSSQR